MAIGNARLTRLHPYPFERLGRLLADRPYRGEKSELRLSLGEPKHAAPDFVLDALSDRALLATSLGRYPATRGTPELRAALAAWLDGRFHCSVDPERQVLPVAGTREALFAVAQALLPDTGRPVVRLPNPFYQIYEGASLLAGAQVHFYRGENLSEQPGGLGTMSADDWRRTDLVYLCTPANPSGALWSREDLVRLVQLANEHDVLLLSDECYSEIYSTSAPPSGLLEAAVAARFPAFDRCLVFNSLSKRSNLPGLRSGLVAGDAEQLAAFLRYRTYQGCALPWHTQEVSRLAWSDEAHVAANRDRYQQKLIRASERLSAIDPVAVPPGGFFSWLPVSLWQECDDEILAQRLKADWNLEILPGRYLARDDAFGNPGAGRVRIAWVADESACDDGLDRLLAAAQ
ncbi:MAG: aminotransferase class I/II-fold pyridoxal phosphate-dependent enzyme [Pseudomonadota bacterium]